MISKCFLVIAIACILLMITQALCGPVPDSAGIVSQPKGLAYGGIPYGSISGQLSLYFGDYEPILLTNKLGGSEVQIL